MKFGENDKKEETDGHFPLFYFPCQSTNPKGDMVKLPEVTNDQFNSYVSSSFNIPLDFWFIPAGLMGIKRTPEGRVVPYGSIEVVGDTTTRLLIPISQSDNPLVQPTFVFLARKEDDGEDGWDATFYFDDDDVINPFATKLGQDLDCDIDIDVCKIDNLIPNQCGLLGIVALKALLAGSSPDAIPIPTPDEQDQLLKSIINNVPTTE